MPNSEQFGLWLDRTLSNRKIKGGDIARKLGVTDSAVSRWRSGDQSPKMDTCIGLAKVLDVEPMRLAATAGLIPPEAGFDPYEAPPAHAAREAYRKNIYKLPHITDSQKRELMEAYEQIVGN